MSMESLQRAVIDDMQSGYRPTYRGHAWGMAQFADLNAANAAIEVAFNILKGVQFPEMRASRASDSIEQIRRHLDEAGAYQYQHNEEHPALQAGDTLG